MDIKIAEAIENASTDEMEVLEDYSGRCMYGETTAAVTCDNPAVFIKASCAAVAQAMYDEQEGLAESIIQAMGSLRFDSMGRGSVIY